MSHDSARRWQLFVASALMLYFELAFIRWIPGQVRVIAYFTNFILIACFFGIGLGMLIARRAIDTVRVVALAVLGLAVLAAAFSGFEVVRSGSQALLVVYENGGPQVPLHLLLALFYLAIAATFVPFGQAVGRAMGREAPLVDYVINLAGSIAGIVAFFFISLFSLPAWSWFLIGAPMLMLIVPGVRRWRAVSAVAAAAVVLLTWHLGRDQIWSPYHKLELAPAAIEVETGVVTPYRGDEVQTRPLPLEVGFNVQVNDDFYQIPVDLSDASIAEHPGLTGFRRQYDAPFRFKPAPDRVLIVGAGTGNDAAAALRNGARHVDVVDIDPEIIAIGRARHPEQPYSDPRVRVYVDDARHFFHNAEPGYDLVIFGFLDSHRLLSAMSSLRLDSYVFTVESFQEVRRLLAPDGLQVTSFAVNADRFVDRLYAMLLAAYDEPPQIVHELGVDTVGVMFLSGPGLAALSPRWSSPRSVQDVVAATDDWPFFYAEKRSIPKEYVIALGLVAVLSFLALGAAGGANRPNPHFFFLGAGFMLVETRNITSVALAFGSTWYVNSVVFFSILVMAILSTALLMVTRRIKVHLVYLGLFAAVGLSLAVRPETLAAGGVAQRLLVVGGLAALPLFFSGLVFAFSFKTTANPSAALGSNIMGGVLGGVVEYLAMITGLRALLWLVILFYFVSWYFLRRSAGSWSPVLGR
jgi:SAM-dependent methyltransferase